MEKRLILAIAISLLVLLSWSALVSKTYHIENKEVAIKSTQPIPSMESKPAPLLHIEEESPSSLFKFAQEKFDVTFIEPKAAIKEIVFKTYQDYIFPLQYGFLLDDNTLLFKKENSSPDTVTFVHSEPSKKITKEFIFFNSSYTMELNIKIQNLSNTSMKIDLPLVLGALDFSSNDINSRYKDVTMATKEKTKHLNARKNIELQDVKFLALRDRYFCAIIEPNLANYTGFIKTSNHKESGISLNLKDVVLGAGQELEQKFHIYLGPQELKLINHIEPAWAAVIYYGTFDFISQILLQLLGFLNNVLHNWGWAIVALSLIVYLCLYPLTLKQMRSMKEMQVVQPKVEELRQIYKDNPQKLNKEIMELYRKHKVNPFGGCLPLLLQMPIFFALYQALMRSVVLRGASFLWIKDLSEPDRLFILPTSLPILGNEINILPIAMAIGMFIQQKMSMKTTSSGSAEQQKMMLIIFPLMFGFIFYHMPSGLVLYWFINSSLMLLYQFRISRAK